MRRVAVAAVLALVAALLAAGCTVPGASRLEGPPKGLPKVFASVPADVAWFSLVDTASHDDHASMPDWLAPALVQETYEPTLGSPPSSWGAGEVAGIGVRSLDRRAGARRFLFTTVAKRSAFEHNLRVLGWTARHGMWTLPRSESEFRALRLVPGGAVAAADEAALDDVLDAADDYAVSERTAMANYTVTAMRRSAAAVVFRTDVARIQVRHLFEADPATLEFARWATSADTIDALRDGWIGVSRKAAGGAPRIIGEADFVPDLAPDVSLEPVDRTVLDELTVAPDVAVAVHDPGQFAVDVVRGITGPGIGFVTDGDVPEGRPKVELLPALEALEGDGALAWSRSEDLLELRTRVDDPVEVAMTLQDVADHAGLAARIEEVGSGVRALIALHGRKDWVVDQGREPVQATLDRAGKPQRLPVAWLYAHRPTLPAPYGACVERTGGWITWDGTERLALSLGVEMRTPACDPIP